MSQKLVYWINVEEDIKRELCTFDTGNDYLDVELMNMCRYHIAQNTRFRNGKFEYLKKNDCLGD